MFGLGFSEMVLVGIVLLVVVGPRELPKLLRTLGRGITKLKAMSADLRDQSGIDEIIEDEDLREDLDAIRSLSRGNIVNSLVNQPRVVRRPKPAPLPDVNLSEPEGEPPDPEVEYPAVGCDAYDALADDALPHEAQLHHPADVASDEEEDDDADDDIADDDADDDIADDDADDDIADDDADDDDAEDDDADDDADDDVADDDADDDIADDDADDDDHEDDDHEDDEPPASEGRMREATAEAS